MTSLMRWLDQRASRMSLERKIKRIEQGVLALAQARFPCAAVFSFGATEIDPKYLAIWIATDTDAQRDELANDASFRQALIGVLESQDYPSAAIPYVGFAFQSEETVKRDYRGNWWYAVK